MLAAPRPFGASDNRFIRFHFTGSLELALMALDLYDATGNDADLADYLPFARWDGCTRRQTIS